MNIWRRIWQMNFKQLVRLTFLFLKKPLLIIPTLNASKETLETCDFLFEKLHHNNGRENAFRHALWNVLICEKTLKFTKCAQKSIIWTEKVTNLYEKVTKNDLLDEAMDLHNNEIGRMLFLNENLSEKLILMQKMLKNAKKVTNIDEIESFHGVLIYISE